MLNKKRRGKAREKKERREQERKKIAEFVDQKRLYSFKEALEICYPHFDLLPSHEKIEQKVRCDDIIEGAKKYRMCIVCGGELHVQKRPVPAGRGHVIYLDHKFYCTEEACDFSISAY